MKKRNKLEALFPNGKIPDANEFNRSLDKMSTTGKHHLQEKIYKLAFTVWSTLPKKQQKFIENVIIHDRQSYVDFMQQKTVTACLRYPLRYPVLFIRMLHLSEIVERSAQGSLNHLTMSVLISFQICGKIGTLAGHISKGGITSEEVLILAGKVTILEYCGG
ncbi:hypothetical protein [Parabacteroides sp.]